MVGLHDNITISSFNEVEVEVEDEFGKNYCIIYGIFLIVRSVYILIMINGCGYQINTC